MAASAISGPVRSGPAQIMRADRDRPAPGVVRVFRVLRILRLFGAFKFLSQVNDMLFQATRELWNYGVMMMLGLFMFAILATNLLWDIDDDGIQEMFRDLGSSMWSLFKLMTMDVKGRISAITITRTSLDLVKNKLFLRGSRGVMFLFICLFAR